MEWWITGLGDSATLIWVGECGVLCFWFQNNRMLVLSVLVRYCGCARKSERHTIISSQQERCAHGRLVTKQGRSACAQHEALSSRRSGPCAGQLSSLHGPAVPHSPSMDGGRRIEEVASRLPFLSSLEFNLDCLTALHEHNSTLDYSLSHHRTTSDLHFIIMHDVYPSNSKSRKKTRA